MINIFQPDLNFEEQNQLKEVFESNWFGRGEKAKKFQKDFAEFQKFDPAKVHTVSCASDAIFAILSVLKLSGYEGTIIAPTISFPAVGSAILANNFKLALCDVEEETCQIDLERLASICSSIDDVVAVFLTHYGGSAVNISAARQVLPTGTLVLEDSACAFGSFAVDGSAIGNRADFSCWSFDPMKLLVCGEGSAVFINDPHLLNIFKEYTYLGLPSNQKSGIDASSNSERWWEYQLNSLGVRSVFSDLNAAIGIESLKTIDEKLSRKRAIAKLYDSEFQNLNSTFVCQNHNVARSSQYFYTIKCEQRDALAKFLKENGIYSTFRYYPLNKIKLFAERDLFRKEGLYVNSDKICETHLNIPVHHALSDSDVDCIIQTVKNFDAMN